MKKRKILLIVSILLIILAILTISWIVFSMNKNNYVFEQILKDMKSERMAKAETETEAETEAEEQIQEDEEAVLPIKISYSDISIEQTIDKVTKIFNNAEEVVSNQEKTIAKVEVNRKKVDSSQIKVKYNMKVSNKGNESGTIEKIIVKVPKNMKVADESNSMWNQKSDDTLEYKDLIKIEAGKEKNIELVVIGEASQIMGKNVSEAMLISSEEIDQRVFEKDKGKEITENNVKEEMSKTNNYTYSSLITSIETRLEDYILVIIISIILLLIGGIGIYTYIRKKSDK